MILGLETRERLGLASPTSGVMPTLAPGGKTGSAAKAEEVAATIRATAARYRTGFMKDLPGLHGGRSVRSAAAA